MLMLTNAELERIGPATSALHKYYMKCCVEKEKSAIVVKFKRHHLLRDSDGFPMGYDDLYDLLALDALDVSLICCLTL